MKKEKKDTNITFRCTKNLKKDIEDIASIHERSVSDYVNMQLKKHVQLVKTCGQEYQDFLDNIPND